MKMSIDWHEVFSYYPFWGTQGNKVSILQKVFLLLLLCGIYAQQETWSHIQESGKD